MTHLLESPFGLLLIQLTLIVGLSRLLGAGFRRLGQPMVIAEIIAGIMLGPSLLGWFAPELMQSLFPAHSLSLLEGLSQVGLLLFMFLIGLELDPGLMRGKGHASVAISHASIFVPFVLGVGAAVFWLRERLLPDGVSIVSFALFMGIAMSVTAFPVLARILSERRLLRSRVGALAITCAAVDDVTAWCLLAFVVAVVKATSLGGAAVTTLLSLAFILAMIFLIRPFMVRLSERVATREGLTQGKVALLLVALLVSASATEVIEIHALFGAFLFGAIIPKEGGLAATLAEKLEDVAVVLLLPIFFAYSGLRTQLGLLNTSSEWLVCGAIILLACLGKFGGSAIAARMTGMRWREAGAIGILMNTRGLMELVVLNLGLDLGVISPTLFTMMVVMALVTTFMTSPLLRLVYPSGELASDLEPVNTPALGALRPLEAPGQEVPGGFRALLCVSHEHVGRGMATLGRALTAPTNNGHRVFALHLVDDSERGSVRLRNQQSRREPAHQDAAPNVLAPLMDRAGELGMEVRPLSFVSSTPAEDICRVAEAKDVDVVVLGCHRPLWSRTILGGVVGDVLGSTSAHVAVLVDRGLDELRQILVPYAWSQQDQAALLLARRLVHFAGARLTVLFVPVPGESVDHSKARLKAHFAAHPELLDRVSFEVVADRTPEEAVQVEMHLQPYDLLVTGLEGALGVEQRLFGLLPERFIQTCPLSMLIVHQPQPRPSEFPEAVRVPEGGVAGAFG